MTGGPPSHSARCARLLRQQAVQHGIGVDQLALEIHRHCHHSMLRSYRMAYGWTLEELIERIMIECGKKTSLTPSRTSRWERGVDEPSRPYRDAICRVYHADLVKLGLASEYRSKDESACSSSHSEEWTPLENPARKFVENANQSDSTIETGSSLISRGIALRRRIDSTLSGSALPELTITHLETIADQYGRVYKQLPTDRFLANVLADLDEVSRLAARSLPAIQRRDVCAVTARLAGLVSMTMVNKGQYREAREWAHTARLSADEASDPALRAWVATRNAVAHLHFGDPNAALNAAHDAELFTRSRPVSVTAMAWAIIARAAGLQGDFDTANRGIHRATEIFQTVNHGKFNTAYEFTVAQLHFYSSDTFTRLGETRAARDAQEAALAAFGPEERLDPTLVRLDRAVCMIREGDITGGAAYATSALLNLPDPFRPTIVLRRTQAVAEAVPVKQRRLPAVRDLHEALAIAPSEQLPATEPA